MRKSVWFLLVTTVAVAAVVVIAGCSEGNDSTKRDAKTAMEKDTRASVTFPLGQKIEADRFVGSVYLAQMIPNDTVYNFPQTNSIVFEPGARSSWHRHGGMIVLATGGVGYYQEEGKKAQILRKGDVVQIPAGVKHWHGATADSWFSQIVIYDSKWQGAHDEGKIQHVSAEDYAKLETEEYTGRDKVKIGDLMFSSGDKDLTLPTFNGPVRLSNIVGEKNVAGSPDLHYVVFDKGVINNWHSHEGGQILIATDGIGYHQIEGEPVQVLHPGDVALCPPGVKHWHGGSLAGKFAHIAANANPERPGVEWSETRIPDEEYRKLPKE